MSINNCSRKKYKRIRIVLYVVLGFILAVTTALNAITGLAVYYDNFVPKKYTASTMICIMDNVDASNGDNSGDSRVSSNSVKDSNILTDNFAVISRYAEEMRSLIPSGYSVSISPVEESNVLSITVTGSDPQVCADTANALRDAAPEVFSEYYESGKVEPFGYPAAVPTAPSSVPSIWAYIIISAIVVTIMMAIYIVIVIFIEKMFKIELKAQCDNN